jgi:hypothetical protein
MKLPSLTFTILYLKQTLKEMLNTTNENAARGKKKHSKGQNSRAESAIHFMLQCFGRRLKMMEFFFHAL